MLYENVVWNMKGGDGRGKLKKIGGIVGDGENGRGRREEGMKEDERGVSVEKLAEWIGIERLMDDYGEILYEEMKLKNA